MSNSSQFDTARPAADAATDGYPDCDMPLASSESEKDRAQSTMNQNQDETEYPRGIKLFLIGLGLMLAVVCSNLDRSILGVAIPQITSEFGSLSDVGWYGSAYLLTSCCSQLTLGKLYAEYNIKWVFMSSLAVFEVGSVICATAPSSNALIVGRAIAGLGATGISTGAMLPFGAKLTFMALVQIISHSMPVSQRPRYTAMIGAGMGITLVFAPFLGGVFTSNLTWRWCFWINLPLGGLTLFTTLFLIRLPKPREHKSKIATWSQFADKFDVWGNLILMASVICLLLALQWGGTIYDWSNWRTILLLCVFGVLGLIWCHVQVCKGDSATVPIRLLKMRSILASMWFAFSIFGMLFVQSYYVPIWFQAVFNETAYKAGINILASTIAMTVGFPIAGVLTSTIGYYTPFMIASSILSAVASGLTIKFNPGTSTGYWMATLIVSGLGFGLGGQQCMMVPQTILQNEDIALGTSVIMFAETISGAVFLAVCESLFTNRLTDELRTLMPTVDPEVIIAVGVSELKEKLSEFYDAQTVTMILQAVSNALQPVWIIAALLASLSLFGALGTEWVRLDKPDKQEKGG